MSGEGGNRSIGFSTKDQWRRPHAFASAALVLALAGLVVPGAGLFAVVVALISRARCRTLGFVPLHQHTKIIDQANCAANLKQAAQAILLYSNDNRGRDPKRFEKLSSYTLAANTLVCPHVHARGPASFPTDEVQARARGQLSYVMVEPRITKWMSSVPAEERIVFERLADHNFEGAHILYCDGQPGLVPREQYLKQLELYRGTSGLTEEEDNSLTGK